MSFIKEAEKGQLLGLSLVISILFLDMLLYSLIIPIIPYYTEQLHLSSTVVGILFASYALALFVTTPFFGRLTDQVGRKLPIIIGLFGLAISTCLFMWAQSALVLILARLVQGTAAAASWTAALAFLADVFPGKSRGPAMGLALTGISAGSLLGAPIGGSLYEWGGHQTPFVVASILILACILFVMFCLKESQRVKSVENTGLLVLLKNRSVLFIAGIVLSAEVIMTLLEPVLPMFYKDRFAFTPLEIGLVFGVMTLAYGVTAPLSGSLSNRYNPYLVMVSGLFAMAICLPLLVYSTLMWQVVISIALVGGAIGFTLSPTLSSLGGIIDQGEGNGDYGVAYALFNMFHAVGMIAGPLIGGILTDIISVQATMVAVSLTIMAVAIFLFSALKATPQHQVGR